MNTHPLDFIRQITASRDWARILDFADRTQMSLLLADAPGQPAWFRDALQLRTSKNAVRLRRLHADFDRIAAALASRSLDFVLLKGFSHAEFGIDPTRRVQYDLDLFCDPPAREKAVDTLLSLGYHFHSRANVSDQHLPPLVMPNQWRWTGDYFDSAMPIAVELHTTLWEPDTDRIELHGPQHFWQRRLHDSRWLSLPDRIAYAALHVLRHILRNDARPAHVYELACMLETFARNPALWRRWTDLHDAPLRRLQAVAFRFAVEWFGCSIPDAAAREMALLGPRIESWFRCCGRAPAENLVRPNKDAIWLHLALLESARDRLAILRRRLLPLHRPKTHGSTGGARVRHHASTIAPALATGLRWWFRSTAS